MAYYTNVIGGGTVYTCWFDRFSTPDAGQMAAHQLQAHASRIPLPGSVPFLDLRLPPFDAPMDGQGDDTPALALAALVAPTFPSLGVGIVGTCRLTQPLYLPDGFTIFGASSEATFLADAVLPPGGYVYFGFGMLGYGLGSRTFTGELRDLNFVASPRASGVWFRFLNTDGLVIERCNFDYTRCPNSMSVLSGSYGPWATQGSTNPRRVTWSWCQAKGNATHALGDGHYGGEGFSGASIDGLVMDHCRVEGVPDDSVAIHECKNVRITNLEVYSPTGMLNIMDSTDVQVDGVTLTAIPWPGDNYPCEPNGMLVQKENFQPNSPVPARYRMSNVLVHFPPNVASAANGMLFRGLRDAQISSCAIVNEYAGQAGSSLLAQFIVTADYVTQNAGTWTDPTGIEPDNLPRPRNVSISDLDLWHPTGGGHGAQFVLSGEACWQLPGPYALDNIRAEKFFICQANTRIGDIFLPPGTSPSLLVVS